jgi:hypothetical protein
MTDDGPQSLKAPRVRRHWFDGLDEDRQDAIIKPAFEEACPTNAQKRKITEDFDRKMRQ